jgi:hypothetical protein
VKEMYLEKLMDVIIILKLSTALLKMQDPVETRVPDLWRKTQLYSTTLYASHKCTGVLLSAKIFLQKLRHKHDTVIGQHLMRLFLIYPEVQIGTSVFVGEEVAK